MKANALSLAARLTTPRRSWRALTPIERHCKSKRTATKQSREAIRRKAAEEKKLSSQARIDASSGGYAVVSIAVLEALTDEQFNAELATATKALRGTQGGGWKKPASNGSGKREEPASSVKLEELKELPLKRKRS